MKERVDYDMTAVANECHLKLTALRQAIKALTHEAQSAQLDAIGAYKAAGFSHREIRDIMLIGPQQ